MAQLTITIPDNQVPRVREAFAFALNLGSPSSQTVTLQTIQDYVVSDLKQFTKNAEARQAAITAVQSIGSPQEIKFE